MKNLTQEIKHGNFWVFILIIALVLWQIEISFVSNREYCNQLKHEIINRQYTNRTSQ